MNKEEEKGEIRYKDIKLFCCLEDDKVHLKSISVNRALTAAWGIFKRWQSWKAGKIKVCYAVLKIEVK